MNILHHKSWHVRNKDNIQRVRRDEAKAAADEKEKQKKIAIAESEARINFLRAKSSGPTKLVEYDEFLNQEHVNLFESEQKGKFNQDKNEEAEQDKKKEQEEYEKKIGLLKYLVDKDDLDLKKQPWYKTVKKRSGSEVDQVEVDLKRKKHLDPLETIKILTSESDEKKKDKKKKKHKDKEKEKSEPKRAKTIEELRAERLKRETEERLKAQRLLSGCKEDKEEPKIEADDRKRKYNNQFNPELSKF